MSSAPASPPSPLPPSPPPGSEPFTTRLTRPRDDRIVAGVAAGIARYLRVDPLLVRAVLVVLALAGGGGILVYLVAWVLMPEDSEDGAAAPTVRRDSPTTVGAVLVLIGGLLLVQRLAPAFPWRYAAPFLLVALGVLLVARGRSTP